MKRRKHASVRYPTTAIGATTAVRSMKISCIKWQAYNIFALVKNPNSIWKNIFSTPCLVSRNYRTWCMQSPPYGYFPIEDRQTPPAPWTILKNVSTCVSKHSESKKICSFGHWGMRIDRPPPTSKNDHHKKLFCMRFKEKTFNAFLFRKT